MRHPLAPVPFGKDGDSNIELTYAAKGRAISAWEEVEVALGGLYAVAVGRHRHDPEGWMHYGEPLNFRDRLVGLESAVQRVFQRHCDQGLEGRFEAILRLVRRHARTRNEITHSHVQPAHRYTSLKTEGGMTTWTHTYQFYLIPPRYTTRKHDKEELPRSYIPRRRYRRLPWTLQDFRYLIDWFTTEMTVHLP